MSSTPVELPADHIAARQAAVRRALVEASLDALLVVHRPNIAYLSGFHGSAGFLLAGTDSATLITDARYEGEVDELVRAVGGLSADVIRPGEGSIEARLIEVLARLGVERLGFEASYLTVAQHTGLQRRVEATGRPIEWVEKSDVVENLRVVKDAWELGVLAEAGRRLSDVSKCIISKALAGSAERQVAAAIEWEMRRMGFDKPAFDTIVASGPNAALPHYRAGERVLTAGDLVVVDFGGMFRGYAVDMTRTLTVGTPSTRQRTCWDTVATAHRAAFAAARVGVAGHEVDGAARTVIDAAGMGSAFVHGLGHGLGLEVHERPRLSRRRADSAGESLAEGMVFTLEPGVYFPGWGGVRIEDDAVATAGGPQWLTEPVDELWTT
jgi:Xaa-Pro aminopeptidase